ncbi:MAG: SHOCT domain-containing protein [Solirubrobacteraceae bacterium]
MPPGEPGFEKTVHSRLNTLKCKGDTVPVLYDPDDHDKVVVDYRADAQAEMDRLDALQRHNQEWEARQGKLASSGRHDPVAGTDGARLDPELQELMDLEEAQRQGAAATPPAITRPATTPSTAGSQARLDRLQQLGYLRDNGVLTDAEFAQEKKRILGES